MDGDAFFVACEVAKNPKLRGLPVVTGEERGIASALSYEAKALGLKRGDPIFRIKKNYPTVLVLPGDYKSYAEYSRKMFDIVRRYADDVEEYSIDECFADLTGLDKPLQMTYREIAKRIKREINDELDLSISIGLGPSKCLAKVASKWVKPNGLTVIEKENLMDFLSKTPIGKIWGIGSRTSAFLRRHGIETAGDFVRQDIEWIKRNLSKPYEVIWQELRGIPVMKVDSAPKTIYSSMQRTRTFPKTKDKNFLLSQFSKNTEDVCAKARYYNLVPKSIFFFLKTQTFRYSGYSMNLVAPTNTPEIIFSLVHQNFHKIYKPDVDYRTTGIVILGLTPSGATQQDLFGGSEITNKFELIHEKIDRLENKFGKRLVYLASTHKALKRKVKGTDASDIDRNLLFM